MNIGVKCQKRQRRLPTKWKQQIPYNIIIKRKTVVKRKQIKGRKF